MEKISKCKNLWIFILALITTICISVQVVNRFILF